MTPNNTQNPAGPGCDEFDPDSLSYDNALAIILSTLTTQTKTKTVKLRKSLGRILAEDIKASMDVPNHTNSAMDGYAIKGSDLNENGFANLEVIGTAYAGKPFDHEVYANQSVKIMTGAIMPKGADTVIMQEYIEVTDNNVEITKSASPGQNVRYAGEDIKQGAVVLKQGTRVGSAALGVIASMGCETVSVYKKPRVAYFSNGDEVRKVGEPLGHGEVYDSNRHTLYALLKRSGAKGIDLGVIGDTYDDIKSVIMRGNEISDMVITSAGASVGEADYIYDIICELGEIKLWKIAIKPGRPIAFAQLSKSVFFGLPGNPVSVMVTYALCVKPAIEKLSGQMVTPPLMIKAKTTDDLRKRPGRSEYQRGIIYRDEHGELWVNARKYQGSGVLSSMSKGNCFIVLDLDSEAVKAGEQVDVLLFSELF